MNGEETGDLENVANEEEEPVSNSCYYDKTKSFFDNLSCDNSRYRKLTSKVSLQSSLNKDVWFT